jgi:hypothetical protein
MNSKELDEVEKQNYILSDPNNETMNLYQYKNKLFNICYYFRVVLNNQMDPVLSFSGIVLSHVQA